MSIKWKQKDLLKCNEASIRNRRPVLNGDFRNNEFCTDVDIERCATGVISVMVRRLPSELVVSIKLMGIQLAHKWVIGFFRFSSTHLIRLRLNCGGASPTITSLSNSITSCLIPKLESSRTTQCTFGMPGTGSSTRRISP